MDAGWSSVISCFFRTANEIPTLAESLIHPKQHPHHPGPLFPGLPRQKSQRSSPKHCPNHHYPASPQKNYNEATNLKFKSFEKKTSTVKNGEVLKYRPFKKMVLFVNHSETHNTFCRHLSIFLGPMQSCSQETKMTQKSGRNKAKTKLVVRIAFAKQTPCARRARLHTTWLTCRCCFHLPAWTTGFSRRACTWTLQIPGDWRFYETFDGTLVRHLVTNEQSVAGLIGTPQFGHWRVRLHLRGNEETGHQIKAPADLCLKKSLYWRMRVAFRAYSTPSLSCRCMHWCIFLSRTVGKSLHDVAIPKKHTPVGSGGSFGAPKHSGHLCLQKDIMIEVIEVLVPPRSFPC